MSCQLTENFSKDMNKTTNKAQTKILLNRIQEEPDVARGFIKESRDKFVEFWRDLTLELNSAGPPMKSGVEWKKVWADQRRYVRKKAAQNKALERGTGGGPNMVQKFSPTEEAIFQLVGMKQAVEGVGAAQSFGLPPAPKRKRTDKDNQEPAEVVEESAQSPDAAAGISDCLPSASLRQSEAACSNLGKLKVMEIKLTSKTFKLYDPFLL